MSYIENLKTEITNEKTKQEIESFEKFTDDIVNTIEKTLRDNLRTNTNNTIVQGYFRYDEGSPEIWSSPPSSYPYKSKVSDSEKKQIINSVLKKVQRLECNSFEINFKQEPIHKTESYISFFGNRKTREVFSHYVECIYIEAKW